MEYFCSKTENYNYMSLNKDLLFFEDIFDILSPSRRLQLENSLVRGCGYLTVYSCACTEYINTAIPARTHW